MDNIRKVYITDPVTGAIVGVESNNALPVNVQDQHTEIIDHYLHTEGSLQNPAATVTIDTRTFLVATGTVAAGNILCFQEGTNFFQAMALSVAVASPNDTITIDSPFDFAFTTAAIICVGSNNMNVDGSSTPVEFVLSPKNLTNGQEWDIVRLVFTITDQSSMDFSTFGGIAALTNGAVLRISDGDTKHIFNVKTNGDFSARAYDTAYADKAPAGYYGFSCRRTFGGQSKNGVTIRLTSTTNDELKILIQDDLRNLDSFYCIAQGHVVTD